MAYSSSKTIYGLWLQRQESQQMRVAQQQIRDEERQYQNEERDYRRSQDLAKQSQAIGMDIERSRESAFNRNVKLAELEGRQAAEMGEAAPQYTNDKFNQYAANAGRGVEGGRMQQEFTSDLGGQLDDRKSQNWQQSRMGAEEFKSDLGRQDYDYKQDERERRTEEGYTHTPGSEVFGRAEEDARRFDENIRVKDEANAARQTSANASRTRARQGGSTKSALKGSAKEINREIEKRTRDVQWLLRAIEDAENPQARAEYEERLQATELRLRQLNGARDALTPQGDIPGVGPGPWSEEFLPQENTTGNKERGPKSLAETLAEMRNK